MKNLLLVGTALVCFSAAAVLLVMTGLPERVSLSGKLPVAPELGAIAPDFEADTADGDSVQLVELRGAPVVLNFWATWCVPCRVEMPELQAVYEAHRQAGLRVVGVNLAEAPEDVLDWRDQLGLTFDLVLDTNGSIASRYLLRGQPTTFVISPDGVITHIFYGATTASALESAIAPFFQ